jgi:hypothetical protein
MSHTEWIGTPRGLLTGGPVAAATGQAVASRVGITAFGIVLAGVLFRRRTV